MTPTNWDSVLTDALDHRREQHTIRQRRPVHIVDSTHVEIDGQRFTNFSSNNYLGLTHHPRVISAFETAVEIYGVGSGAAALVTGHSDLHASAERALASWKGTESAVLLSSGYAANQSAIQMLAAVGEKTGVRFLLDKLCHASLVDAVRAVADETKVTFRIFPHNHMAKLRRLLEEAEETVLQVVITESIFSMDGDAADLAGIAELKKHHPFLLLLDEAHGSGVYGPNGSGYAVEMGLGEMVDITIVTLSKALGCSGGAICASNSICEAIVNFGRSYIFSTAIPPAIAAAVEAAINVMRDEPHRQHRVRELARRVRSRVLKDPGDSPILPIVLGDEAAALKASERLMQRGLLAVAVRPPTVPKGTSRLRVTVNCDHSDEEVEHLIATLT
jgi:8-amino-7-oxononanoate synthase